MGISILADGHQAVMFDNTRDWSIGPLANECEGCGASATTVLEGLLKYAEVQEIQDIRELSDPGLGELWKDYMTDHHDHEG